jgi:integrase
VIEPQRIHPRAVTRAVQRCVADAGLAGHFSAHSLRAGLATSAYAHGADPRAIQRQGRWKDARSLDRYIRLDCLPNQPSVLRGLL